MPQDQTLRQPEPRRRPSEDERFQELSREVQRDARKQPERYLEQSLVPEGGE